MSSENAIHMAFDIFDPSAENADLQSPPVVFLHCYTWNRKIYREVVQKISKKTGRKVYSLDIRNHGDSPKPQEFNIQLIHNDIDLFFKTHHLNLASFICHSFSSSAVALFAYNNPTLVEKIVIVDYYPYVETADKNMIREEEKYFKLYRSILEKLTPNLTLQEARQFIARTFCFNKRMTLFVEKILDELVKEGNCFKWKTDKEFLFKASLRGDLKCCSEGPYCGEILFIRPLDTYYLSDLVLQRTVKDFPKAKILTMKDCSHMLIFEKTEEFLEEVRKFLLQSEKT